MTKTIDSAGARRRAQRSAPAPRSEHASAPLVPSSLGARALDRRQAGVLLHVTSLPGRHGSGDLGPEARAFVDFLASAGQRMWQMLPVVPPGAGRSPYSSVSTFAGDPSLIGLDDLVKDGLLSGDDVAFEMPPGDLDAARVDPARADRLRRAFARFSADRAAFASLDAELSAFRRRAAAWLADYALFMALKRAHDGAPWTQWEPALRDREPAALEAARARHADEVAYVELEQLLFDRQWRALRAYASERDVALVGDAPIFVAHDSADVWAHRAYFRLDAEGNPTHVAGVPPDYFSKTGQLWGNPLYRWKRLKRDGYKLWIDRFRALVERFD
ncbi:hypothetical protein EON77_16830, partial [bacterium]